MTNYSILDSKGRLITVMINFQIPSCTFIAYEYKNQKIIKLSI